MIRKTIIISLVFFLVFYIISSGIKITSAEIVVPDDYSKIQDAINAANEGETIIVKEGIYSEKITINKRITLKSEKGNKFTIIDLITRNIEKAIEINSGGVKIEGFTIKGGTYGIYFKEVGGINITNNIIDSSIAIEAIKSNEIYISKNLLRGDLRLIETNNSNILNNTFLNKIYISESLNVSIKFNVINQIHTGIEIWNSEKIKILNNEIFNNFIGIRLLSSNNKVSENVIKGNNIGIKIENELNEIFNNEISFNKKGIEIHKGNNLIYMNDFIKNDKNIDFPEKSFKNSWKSKEKIPYIFDEKFFKNFIGNYWSDYNGTDENNDGIGEIAYIIDENNKDEYPLILSRKNYVFEAEIETISPLTQEIETKVLIPFLPIIIAVIIIAFVIIVFFLIKKRY